MPIVQEVTAFLDAFAPVELAESWDNVGLLLGNPRNEITRVMTCLTLTPDVAEEAIRERAGLVVTHHPILFRPVKRLTTETSEGRMLLALAKADVAVYSPHTAFDSAREGINARLCRRLELSGVVPLRVATADGASTDSPLGSGRHGELPRPLDFGSFVTMVRAALPGARLEGVPSPGPVRRVGVACGSAVEFLSDAAQVGCDVLVTGEARFHSAIEARTLGIGLLLLGHYASERFAVEELADVIRAQFADLTVWASRDERDPLEAF